MTDSFALKPLALSGSLDRSLGWLTALSFIPFVITVGVLAFVALHASNARNSPPLALLVAIPLLVLAGQLLLVRSMRRVGVWLDVKDLVVNTGLGSKRIALAHLSERGLRVVDLRTRADLRPFARTRGAGLPGLSSGWFRLRNGERALCVLLGRERVCYLRSDADNLSLLLSLKDPEALRAQLQR